MRPFKPVAVVPIVLLALLGAPSIPAQESLEKNLGNLIVGVERHPEDFLVRAERAWLKLAGAETTPGGMPDTAAADVEIRRLRAYYFHRLMLAYGDMVRESGIVGQEERDQRLKERFLALKKRYRKTEAELRDTRDTLIAFGPGRARFQAAVALIRKDTSEALRAYQSGWERFRLEDDYLSLIRLHRAHGDLREALLEEGLRMHPKSPAVSAAVFDHCLEGARPACPGKALAIAKQGQSDWPLSVEWKIRLARALLATDRLPDAKSVLMEVLDALDESVSVPPAEAAPLRREIFALLNSVQSTR